MKNIRDVAIGLSISVVLFAAFIAAILLFFPNQVPAAQELNLIPTRANTALPSPTRAPTRTAAPTQPFTATPTTPPSKTPQPTATNTAIPLPTSTFTAYEQMIADGQIAVRGALSKDQHIKLYETSLRFIAKTPADSLRVSTEVNGVKTYASTTCGPLAVAILRDAGLIPADIIPHDYWLLNPDVPENRRLLDAIFPKERYDDTRYKVKLQKFDWVTNPLEPGDFVYIYAGTGGNFEHMLVVTRVDSQGRAYSVMNVYAPDGFIIDEILLYDPLDASAGIFRQWTSRQWQQSGSTGFAGFELWRLKESQ